MLRVFVAFLALISSTAVISAQDDAKPISQDRLKQSATQAIQVVQKSQRVWNEKKIGCTSCHHQTLPLLVDTEAHARGINFDTKLSQEVATGAFSFLKDFDIAAQGAFYIDDIDDGWKLVIAEKLGIPSNQSLIVSAQYLLSAQRPDGSWYTIDARPPQSGSRFTATALAIRGVQNYLPKSFKEQKQAAVDRARNWFLKAQPRNTEDRSFQLLGLSWTGAELSAREKFAKSLIAEQQPDGGWQHFAGLGSDAYSTGEALYALHLGAEMPSTDPVYQRGLQYLLKTQFPDGSWKVISRLDPSLPVSPDYFDAGFSHGRHDQFISIMGTQWATLAILQGINFPRRASLRPNASLSPAEQPEWIQIVLTGTAQDLQNALDRWMKPNSKTAQGTTALMLATRDLEKVKVLLAAQADVNAVTDTGYSALTLASRHRGNAEVLKLLLKHGADVNPGKGKPVLNNATPIFFAACNGDVEMVRVLLAAGAKVESDMMVLGMMQMSPLVAALYRGDVSMVKHLLDQKADPNRPGREQISPLHRAVINNHVEVVQELLANGAKVNFGDAEGLTALHYSAMVDYGDTKMMELLLGAKADRTAKDDQGRTPFDIAKSMKHKAHEALLSPKAPAK